MTRLLTVVAAASVALCAAAPGAAGADPGPTPAPPGPGGGFASGWAQCGNRLVPVDPRVDMSNALGGLIYREMLRHACGNDGAAMTP